MTNLIYKLVSHNYESFLQVLRVARVWAKRRGIYSNKLGYFGGINFNILVALVCQLFPRATPSYLLCKFQGRKRVRKSQLQRLLSRSVSTRFG